MLQLCMHAQRNIIDVCMPPYAMAATYWHTVPDSLTAFLHDKLVQM